MEDGLRLRPWELLDKEGLAEARRRIVEEEACYDIARAVGGGRAEAQAVAAVAGYLSALPPEVARAATRERLAAGSAPEALGLARGLRLMKAAADTHAGMGGAWADDAARGMRACGDSLSGLAAGFLRKVAEGADGLPADDVLWISVREPGKPFERAGPYTRGTVAKPLRRLMSSRPAAHLAVMWVAADGPRLEDGPAFLLEVDENALEHVLWHARASTVAQSRLALAADLPPTVRKPALLAELLRQAENVTGYARPGAAVTDEVGVHNGALRRLDIVLHELASASVLEDSEPGDREPEAEPSEADAA